MNALLESKQLLEAKIALSKSLIDKKKKDFDYHTEQANEFQLIIEGLQCETWKDQAALDAVNEQLNPVEEEIPTLALQKKNHLWKELTACLAFLLLTSVVKSQDTILVKKVFVCSRVINKKTGKTEREWFRKMKVKSGYIIKEANGLYIINGEEMEPNYFNYSTVKK